MSPQVLSDPVPQQCPHLKTLLSKSLIDCKILHFSAETERAGEKGRGRGKRERKRERSTLVYCFEVLHQNPSIFYYFL